MYKEVRTLSAENLRNLCIKQHWYTRGTNSEYDNLLFDLAADKENLTTADIIAIAEDISAHSNLLDGQTIECIAFEVNRACIVFFERVQK